MQSPLVRSAVRSAAIASVLITLSVRAAWPQGSARSTPAAIGIVRGARVRLIVADYGDKPQVGTISAVRGDSMVFHREATGDSAILGFRHIGQLELSRGRHSRPLAGLGIGFMTGAAAGAVVGLATYKHSTCTAAPGFGFCGVGDLGAGGNAAGGAILGGLAGGLVGLVTGAFVHSERWHTQSLSPLLEHPQVGITMLSSSRGPRLAFRVAAHF